MEKKENGKSSGKRAVKDLSVKSAASVKGGVIPVVREESHKAQLEYLPPPPPR